MRFEFSRDIETDIFNYYGTDQTMVVCMEELSELIKEVSKYIRGKGNKHHLTEEIADVLITIDELINLHDIREEDIQNQIIYKQFRAARRMQGLEE